MADASSRKWTNKEVYRAALTGTAESSAPFSVTWDPAPAGTPFTTGSYTGVTFTASATMAVAGYEDKEVQYVIVAGGAGGGVGPAPNRFYGGGGGGAGGYVSSVPGESSGTNTNPLAPIVLPNGTYTVTIGAGGGSGGDGGDSSIVNGRDIFIRAGRGGNGYPGQAGVFGSGGGNSAGQKYLNGTYAHGSPGGLAHSNAGAGGGGAGAVGEYSGPPSGNPSGQGGAGGNGLTTAITGTPLNLAGGGAGGPSPSYGAVVAVPPSPYGGGGHPGGFRTDGDNATVNTGGGGGGAGTGNPTDGISILGGNGGSGIVIIRWLT